MKISNTINKYEFRNNKFSYVIHNYDYFTTDYNIPKDQTLNEIGEYSLMNSLIEDMDKSRSVIDIGGNCGLFCVPCSLHGFNVYTFEPISMNITLLELNKKINNCNSLHIIHNGLMNEEKKQEIYIPYCSDNTSFNKEVAISNMNKKDFIEEIVDCIKFDTWIEQNPQVDVGFIKIDVQGYEKQVLEGMTNFLNNCHDVKIFIEWDRKHTEKAGNTLDDVYSLFVNSGFQEIQNFGNDKLFYKK
jgi:FkbM family methyltransferase